MANVQDAAALVVEHYGSIDTFKLQKLLYYSQAWNLVWEGQALFDDPIEAWAAGPVVRSVYANHRGQYTVTGWPYGDSSRLADFERQTIEAVIEGYGELTGRQLSHLTHSERPWQTARHGLSATDRGRVEIQLADMYSYYSALDQDPSSEPVSGIAEHD